VQQAHREVHVIDRAQAECNEDEAANHPEALLKFEFAGTHIEEKTSRNRTT
jgi:hypothetical protein